MWIITNYGFLSAVQDRNNKDRLVVRARKSEHLEKMFPEHPVVYTDNSDYPYRAYVFKIDFTAALSREVDKIDYDNFKNSVKENDMMDFTHNVWYEAVDNLEGWDSWQKRNNS